MTGALELLTYLGERLAHQAPCRYRRLRGAGRPDGTTSVYPGIQTPCR
jgi:hypothetical protein